MRRTWLGDRSNAGNGRRPGEGGLWGTCCFETQKPGVKEASTLSLKNLKSGCNRTSFKACASQHK